MKVRDAIKLQYEVIRGVSITCRLKISVFLFKDLPCNGTLEIDQDSLEACPDHGGYDYFEGSEIPYIIIWTCVGLLPLGLSSVLSQIWPRYLQDMAHTKPSSSSLFFSCHFASSSYCITPKLKIFCILAQGLHAIYFLMIPLKQSQFL